MLTGRSTQCPKPVPLLTRLSDGTRLFSGCSSIPPPEQRHREVVPAPACLTHSSSACLPASALHRQLPLDQGEQFAHTSFLSACGCCDEAGDRRGRQGSHHPSSDMSRAAGQGQGLTAGKAGNASQAAPSQGTGTQQGGKDTRTPPQEVGPGAGIQAVQCRAHPA